MKFLHLSDLHIGKIVNGFSMLEEQRNAFDQVLAYVKAEAPDAVLIAGDVYDRSVPNTDAVHLFDDFLTQLAKENLAVFLISGNHDSPQRLHFASRLLQERQVHLCGVLSGTLPSVTLADPWGDITFWLLPFIKPTSVRHLFPDREVESYTEAVSAVLASANIDYNARNVLLSHQFYRTSTSNPTFSDSELNPIGGLDAVDGQILSSFDYVALGHLHGTQKVGENTRYAGSPIKYSFSECRQKKSIPMVEIKAKGEITVTLLPLSPLHDLREIKGSLDELTAPITAASPDCEDYLRVILTDTTEMIDPLGKLRSVYPNIMTVDYENALQKSAQAMALETMESLSFLELFNQFFEESQGTEMNKDQGQIVHKLLDEWGESS